jgi:hypothetical protein
MVGVKVRVRVRVRVKVGVRVRIRVHYIYFLEHTILCNRFCRGPPLFMLILLS